MARWYPRGGKNWNVGLSSPGLLGATDTQYRYLRALTHIEHRGSGLTVDAASDLIAKALEERDRRQAGLTGTADKMYTALMKKAIREADDAGDKWLARNPEPHFAVHDAESGMTIGVHGQIGMAWITSPKKGSDLYKWMMDHELFDRRNRSVFPIHHKHLQRLEMGLRFAAEKAAFEVFRKNAVGTGNIELLVRGDRVEDLAQAA